MTWRILVSAPYLQGAIERYRSTFVEHGAEVVLPKVVERLSEEELLGLVGDIDGVIAGDDQFTRTVLERALPRLKVLSKWGTGIDSFDLEACAELGIAVCNTPDAFVHPVADSVLGYILSFARQLVWMDRGMKQGAWIKIPGRALNENTLGIIGVGRIGKAVAERARAFGMTVLGNDLLEMPPEFVARTGIRMVDRETLLEQADFVSLNCDLNATSRHLISGPELQRMKPTGVLINLSRGPVIDEPALIAALERGEIAGAALDVFEQEPLPAGSPLLQMDNVMLAPHNSNSSPAAWERVHRLTIDNLFRILERHTP